MKPLQTLLQHHKSLFSKDQGPIHPFTASLQVQQDGTPQFFKPCPIPFVSQELNQLEQQGIISPVTHSKWGIQGDHKPGTSSGRISPTDTRGFFVYIGWRQSIFLDLSQAYLQLPVDKDSSHKYSQRPLCLQPTAVRSGLCSCNISEVISEVDGHCSTRDSWGNLLY